jgi:hypothetical protein
VVRGGGWDSVVGGGEATGVSPRPRVANGWD